MDWMQRLHDAVVKGQKRDPHTGGRGSGERCLCTGFRDKVTFIDRLMLDQKRGLSLSE